MRLVRENKSSFLIGSVLQGLSTALFAPVLWFLYKVIAYRRPEIPPVARWLAIIAPIASGLLFIVSRFQVAHVADVVGHTLSATPLAPDAANDYAKDQLTGGALQTVGGLGLAAGLAMGLALVLIGMNAMRSGVLSRFMGIIGIIVGVLLVLPIFGSVPFVQVFWLGALGLLFLGRWPQGGRGPAWESGEAIPWPTAADRQAAIAAARADREAGREEAKDRYRTAVGAPGGRDDDEDETDYDVDVDGDGANGAEPSHPQHPRS